MINKRDIKGGSRERQGRKGALMYVFIFVGSFRILPGSNGRAKSRDIFLIPLRVCVIKKAPVFLSIGAYSFLIFKTYSVTTCL